jgi:hypothetical protein
MHQAQIVTALDQFGAEYLAVKNDTSFEILDAQDDVIDVFDRERLHRMIPENIVYSMTGDPMTVAQGHKNSLSIFRWRRRATQHMLSP